MGGPAAQLGVQFLREISYQDVCHDCIMLAFEASGKGG